MNQNNPNMNQTNPNMNQMNQNMGPMNQNMYNMNQNMYNMNQNMSQMNYDPRMNQMNPPMTNKRSCPKWTIYMVFSIVQFMIFSHITGLIAMILTIMADSSWKACDMMDYQSKIKGVKISLIIGIFVALAKIALCIIYFIIIGMSLVEALQGIY